MPTTVKDIYDYIDSIAPFKNQESYDNSGLNIGLMSDEVKGVLVALDATTDVIRDAEVMGAQLIVTHHPVIFDPLKQIKFKTPAGRLAFDGINLIASHTSFDSAQLNALLCEKLGLTPTEPLSVENGVPIGFICECASMTPRKLATNVQKALGTTCLRYNDMGGEILRVGVCSGSGGSFLPTAIEKQVDCLITGDVKHSVFIDAFNAGVTVIDAGHFHTEDIFCDYVRELLEKKFPDLVVQTAPSDKDIVSYLF